MHSASDFYNIINGYINDLAEPREPANMYEPISYVLGVGGKRIRPTLCLMANEMFGGNYHNVLPTAIAIEVFHNFTLLHDDIMDNATVRRGKPVVNVKWNNNIAILSGDAMSIISYLLLKDAQNLRPVLKVFSQTALQICEGQQYDMDFESRNNVTVDEYLNMIKLKTAVLIGAALEIGAIEANANINDQHLIYDFGLNVGMAFQLQDDMLDTYGNEKTFGKKIGGDIIENKKTFLIAKSMEIANDNLKSELLKQISMKNFDANEKINSVREIYNQLNIKQLVAEKIDYYFTCAQTCLSRVNLPESTKKTVLEYVMSMRNRLY